MAGKFRTLKLKEGVDPRASEWKRLLAGLVCRRSDADIPDGERRIAADRGRPYFPIEILGDVDDETADRIAEEIRAAGDDLLRRHRREGAVAAVEALEAVAAPAPAAVPSRGRGTPADGPLLALQYGERLGDGGEGEVWAATDKLDRPVAVKVFYSDAPEGASAMEHARALARVRHDNVITVYDVGRAADPRGGDRPPVDVVVLERVVGVPLGERLRGGELVPVGDARRAGLGLLDGLEAIHAAGLEHGDLHDCNVMVWNDGRVRIIDVMYRGTLRYLGSTTRNQRLRADRDDAYHLLRQILDRSVLSPSAAAGFCDGARRASRLAELRAHFHSAFDGDTAASGPRMVPDRSRASIDTTLHFDRPGGPVSVNAKLWGNGVLELMAGGEPVAFTVFSSAERAGIRKAVEWAPDGDGVLLPLLAPLPE